MCENYNCQERIAKINIAYYYALNPQPTTALLRVAFTSTVSSFIITSDISYYSSFVILCRVLKIIALYNVF